MKQWWHARSFIYKLVIIYLLGLFLLGNLNYINEYIQTKGQFPDVVGNWSPIGAYLIAPLLLIALAFYDFNVLTWKRAEIDVVLSQDILLKLFVLWLFLIPSIILATFILRILERIFWSHGDT